MLSSGSGRAEGQGFMGLHLLHTDRYGFLEDVGCSTQLLPAYLQVPHLHCIIMYLFLKSETGFPITEIVLDTFVLHPYPLFVVAAWIPTAAVFH